MKDIRNFLLAMLSIGLVSTWVYHFYDKSMYSKHNKEVNAKEPPPEVARVRDSLQKLYITAISDLDTRLDSTRNNADSLKFRLGDKLNEVFKLQTEIGVILKNKNSTEADLGIARQKIRQLQGLVNGLKEEKKQLNDLLAQESGKVKGLPQNLKQLNGDNNTVGVKTNQASAFVASELELSPVIVKDDKVQETTIATNATKLVISFDVKNKVDQDDNAEIYVVVTQPDGQVLKNDIWESSSIITHNSGKKVYTKKLQFEYSKGETKHLLFSLNADEYQKGKYTLQVYHNGFMIGHAVKTLI